MFDLGWSKLVLIAIVALIVIGPKELPAVLRTVGQWMAKIRRMAAEFQTQFQDAMREAEMADLKQHIDQIHDAAKDLSNTFNPTSFNPVETVRSEMQRAIEGPATPPSAAADAASTSAAAEAPLDPVASQVAAAIGEAPRAPAEPEPGPPAAEPQPAGAARPAAEPEQAGAKGAA